MLAPKTATGPGPDTGTADNWHNDLLRSGCGTLADVGTHAYQLAQYISGQTQLLAELTTFVHVRAG